MRARLLWALAFASAQAWTANPAEMTPLSVEKVVDGDTLRLLSGHRVRLLGIDTPELETEYGKAEYFAAEAAAYVRARIGSGKIRLSYEGRRLDDFGRLLAYVWLEDGVMLERELLSLGYARVYRRRSFSHKAEFLKLQAKARKAGLGLWGRKF